MENDNNSDKLYSFILACEVAKHEENVRRIEVGIRCFFIVPLILLAAMLFTGSSNIAFLLLWIVSLFGIAAYAIIIEYNDYELQKRMRIMERLEKGSKDFSTEELAVLPLISEQELLRMGMDRASTRRLLVMFNRQKRRRRASRGEAADSLAQSGDALNASKECSDESDSADKEVSEQ